MRQANYVVETTTSIAGTSGDGAVTLTAVTNRPRISTVFGTGAVTVRYIIEDTVNKKLETGIGSASGNVLTRSQPLTTWDGTTYKDGSSGAVTALQFGSTPTSGNILIRLGAVAELSAPTMPQVQSVISGDTWRDYPLSAHLIGTSNAGASTAVNGGTEYYNYYKLERAGILKGLQLECTASVAGCNIKLALYSIGAAGLPDQKIVDFNNQSLAATGVLTDTTTSTWSTGGPVFLTPGWYAVGHINSGGGSPGIRAFTNAASQGISMPTPIGRFSASYVQYRSSVSIAGNYTTGLPAVPNLTGGAVGFPFWTGLKVTAP